jgi:hypothetical protein
MTTLLSPPELGESSARPRLLDRPLSAKWCVIGWLVASAIFVGFVRLLQGPTDADSVVSVYSTWAIAHGQWACAYPSDKGGGFPFIGPLYPLLSGGLAALTHVGGSLPFPSPSTMGPHCANAVEAMTHWSMRSNADQSTVRLGYLSWLFLAGGVVALLRAVGRGRCGREPLALALIACSPAVWMPLQQYFHPQDILAVGLILGSLAFVVRGYWGWAGLLLGLALTAQQFPWLVLAPLLVVAPANRRVRLAGGAVLATAIVVLPLVIVTSGRALGPALIGSGGTPSPVGGTVLWEFHLHGASLIAFSRILPILVSMVLARWAVRRLGSGVWEPATLISLMTTALVLRLVFEVNLWGYYFMTVSVMLIVLDTVRGRIRLSLVVWLALIALAFYPFTWGSETIGQEVPRWLWQSLLVLSALVLAARPLVRAARDGSSRHPGQRVSPPDREQALLEI